MNQSQIKNILVKNQVLFDPKSERFSAIKKSHSPKKLMSGVGFIQSNLSPTRKKPRFPDPAGKYSHHSP